MTAGHTHSHSHAPGKASVYAHSPERLQAVRKVLFTALILNAVAAIAKLITGFAIGSLSLVADGFHAILDSASNVVGLVGVSIGAAPPDDEHPYGHTRFETIASIAIGFLIAVGLWEVIQHVVEGVIHHAPAPHITPVSVAIVIGAVVMNASVSYYESTQAKKLGSAILHAESKHTLTDALGAFAVLVSFGASALGIPYADLVAAAIVSLLIGHTAIEVLAPNFRILVDAASLDPAEIRKVALSVEGVHGVHKVRSRGSLDHVLVDFHIQVDPHMSVEDAHTLTHLVGNTVREHFPTVRDVLIHTEPVKNP